MVRKETIIACVLICALAKWQAAPAQNREAWPRLFPSYSNDFSQEDVAYSNTCFDDVFLDVTGRMWLNVCGTQRVVNSIGVYSFDGYRFQPLDFKKQDNSLFGGVSIHGISSEGPFYGIANDRPILMDPATRKIAILPFADTSFNDLRIRALNEVGGVLYVMGTIRDQQMELFALERGQMVHQWALTNPSGFWTSQYHTIQGDSTELWVMGGTLPIYRIDQKEKVVRAYGAGDFIGEVPTAEDQRSDVKNTEPKILKSGSGRVYLMLPAYLGSQLYSFDTEREKFVGINASFPADWTPVDIFRDEDGNSCFLFTDSHQNYQAVIEDIQGTFYDYSAIVEGHRQIENIVAKDYRKQAYLLGDDGLHNVGIRRQEAIEQILPGKWVSSMIFKSDHELLINTIGDSWFVYDTLTKSTQPFVGPDCHLEPPAFGKGMKQQILADTSGNLWFLSYNNLVKYDPVRESCNSYSLANNAQLFAFIRPDLILIQKQRTKIDLFDVPRGETIPLYDWLPRDLRGFVRDIFVDSGGKVWIPTNQGLWLLDFQEQTTRFFTDSEGFNDFRFTAIHEDAQGRLWIGTYFGGLHVYDPKTEEIIIIDQNNGLPNNSIMSIIGDPSGDLWVTTEYGISIISPSGMVKNNIFQEDGLTDDKFERFDAYQATNGQLFFANRKGLNRIRPATLKDNLKREEEVKIFLTEATYYDSKAGREVAHQDLEMPLVSIDIPAEYPGIQLKFALSSYLEPSKNHYAYQIEGKDQGWTYLGAQPEIKISRLPPGRYNILIRGADFRNNWTNEPLVIPIRARKFFYKQFWFYVLMALPFLLFAWIWIRNKQREAQRLEIKVEAQTQKIREDKELIKQQAEELRELDRLKSNFFTNISHELRTPITLIQAPLENVLENYSSRMEQKLSDNLQLVLSNARKLGRLVEELLELSRLDANKVTLKETATPLGVFCEQLFYSYSAVAKLKNMDYHFEAKLEDDQYYLLDRNRLEKVINNLLSNALKFTPDAGQVRMRVYTEEEQIVIELSDTGRGIPVEDLPHLFERYFQTRRDDINTAGGTGIGLALTKELVELMGGQIQVESIWGQGTSFWLRLPAKKTRRSAEEAINAVSPVAFAKADSPPPATAKSKILLVEDNPEMQVLIQSILSAQYQCLITNHGAEAWGLLETEATDVDDIELILSDVMMPKMDGYSLLRKIKSHKRWQGVPVVMLTARSAEEDKLQALRMGVDDYLMKPFSPQELKARIHNLIKNYRNRQQFQSSLGQKGSELDVDFETEASFDQLWLEEVETMTRDALNKGIKLTTTVLASAVHLSDRQFARRLKRLTGLGPNAYIREMKLQKARSLLENGVYTTVGEVAAACGYSTGSYLTKSFQERFGKKPIDYIRHLPGNANTTE